MKTDVDVFVIGGGPAGLVAGIAARRQGLSVIVADGSDHPIDKACGEGLLPEAQSALAKLDIQIPESEGFRFRGIRFLEPHQQVSAEYPQGQGIGIRRTVLHELLAEKAAECGVRLLWKTPVAGIVGNVVGLQRGSVIAQWIVGADGSGSRVRKWGGLERKASHHPRFASRRHYRVKPWTDYMEIYWGERVQAYVTAVSKGELCIVTMAEKAQDTNFAYALENWPELRAKLTHAELSSKERGAISAAHSLHSVYRGNVALVGDASGSVDAITGVGLGLAFSQAIALAEGMKRGNLAEYQRVHRRLAKRPTRMGNLMVLLGRHASIRRRFIKALADKPELFEAFLAIHAGHSAVPRILVTGARMGWEFLAA